MLTALLLLAEGVAPATTYRDSVGAWAKCTANAAKQYVENSTEPAETIVTAAISKCQSEESEARRVVNDMFPGEVETQRQVVKDARERIERFTTGLVLDLRDLQKKGDVQP